MAGKSVKQLRRSIRSLKKQLTKKLKSRKTPRRKSTRRKISRGKLTRSQFHKLIDKENKRIMKAVRRRSRSRSPKLTKAQKDKLIDKSNKRIMRAVRSSKDLLPSSRKKFIRSIHKNINKTLKRKGFY